MINTIFLWEGELGVASLLIFLYIKHIALAILFIDDIKMNKMGERIYK